MRNIPRCREVYTFCPKGIYYLLEGYIPFARKVYTICSKGIYHLLEGYIPFARKVYTICPKGIYLSPESSLCGKGSEAFFPCLREEIRGMASYSVSLFRQAPDVGTPLSA